MADITMCSGLGCPLKEKCHRATATRGIFQSMFTETPMTKVVKGDEELTSCDYFWDNSKRKGI